MYKLFNIIYMYYNKNNLFSIIYVYYNENLKSITTTAYVNMILEPDLSMIEVVVTKYT